jgi:hypothetical protein
VTVETRISEIRYRLATLEKNGDATERFQRHAARDVGFLLALATFAADKYLLEKDASQFEPPRVS